MNEEQISKTGSPVSPVYISYLVRLWRSTGSQDWLASLETPGTHERHSFPDMDSFFAFLQAQTHIEQIQLRAYDLYDTDDDRSAFFPEPP